MHPDDRPKRCSKCGETKTEVEFYYKNEDSLRSECIECFSADQKIRGKDRRDKNRAAYEAGELEPATEKWCKMCDDVLPSEDFFMNFQSRTLLSHYCKKCHRKDVNMRARLKNLDHQFFGLNV